MTHMTELVIQGGKRLGGEVRVQGAKNSALPILAAAAAVEGICTVENCPRLSDVSNTIAILEYLGCKVWQEGDAVTVDARGIKRWDIPETMMREMRSSIIFLGPLLSRFTQVEFSDPGGCPIGQRPINLHLIAMQALGATLIQQGGRQICQKQGRLEGTAIALSLPSVGATENIMIAAATAQGTTTVINAAREPEICDLAMFLNRCGAKIRGAGEGTVYIEGVKKLHGCEHRIIPDRIMATTLMAAAAVTQGRLRLTDVCPDDIKPTFGAFADTGCELETGERELTIQAPRKLCRFRTIHTMPYPGFPTDSQANLMAMACFARGTSMLVENVFNERFKHVAQLRRLGAEIEVESRMAVVEGVPELYGTTVIAEDLRGGAALAVAGLAAKGITRISHAHWIDRGCEDFENCLNSLGADVKREVVHEYEEPGPTPAAGG